MFMKKHIPFIVISLVFFNQVLITNADYSSIDKLEKNTQGYDTISTLNSLPVEDIVFSTKSSSNRSWTYMLYLDADNDIEGDAIRDFEWLEQAGGSDENISIVVLLDRIPGYDNTHGNWNGSRIYNVTKNILPTTIDSQLMVDLGEVDMADPDTLTDFITYCFDNFPAENYILDLWDHGHAAYGVIDDETSSTHFIVNDIQIAITNALAGYSEEIDILSMDACDMMTIEVAWEMRNLCKYFIATETGTNGYPYKLITKALKSSPSMNASALCKEMVDAYSYYYRLYYCCISVINQTKLLDLPEIFNSFVTELTSTLDTGYFDDVFKFLRELSLDFYDGHWVDLVCLIENVHFFLNDTTLNLKAEELLAILDEIILYNWQAHHYFGNANGLTIYMPFGVTALDFFVEYANRNGFCAEMDWQLATTWDEFLTFYRNNHLSTLLDIQTLTVDETLTDCTIQQNSIQLFRVNFWKRSVYEFSCQISSGDIDFKVLEFDPVGSYGYIGGSFLINPDDGNTESCRFRLESAFYLILVFGKATTSNFDIKVQYQELTNLVCNLPYTSTGGSTKGDAQGHFKQDLYHYFQIDIPYGNNTITLSNSETANYQLIIYDEAWRVIFFLPAEGLGEVLTLVYNQTGEDPTTFIFEICGFDGSGDFTIEIKNPNEPTPKAGIHIWQIIFIIPIIYTSVKIKRLKIE